MNRHLFVIRSGGRDTGYYYDLRAYEDPAAAAEYFAQRDSIGAEPEMSCEWEYTEAGKNPDFNFYLEEKCLG